MSSRGQDEVDALVREHLPIVTGVARQIARQLGGRIPVDDLISHGQAALLAAAQSYDPALDTFARHAARKVRWGIMDGLRRETRYRSLAGRTQALLASDAHAADGSAFQAAWSEGECRERLEQHLGVQAVAMVVGLIAADAQGSDHDDPETSALRRQRARIVRSTVGSLPERQRELLRRHYFGGEPFEHIAADLGISKSLASRIHTKALRLLQKRLTALGPSP